LIISDPSIKLSIIMDTLYPQGWLATNATEDVAGRTNREVETEAYLHQTETTRPQTFIGALSQLCATLTHHVSAARLSIISSTIPKVTIVTGDSDDLVSPRKSAYIKKYMEEAEYLVFEETGHSIHMQRKKRYNQLLERIVAESRERAIRSATM